MVVRVGVLYEADAGDDSFREGGRRAEVQLSSLRDVVIRHCPYDVPIFVAKRQDCQTAFSLPNTRRHRHFEKVFASENCRLVATFNDRQIIAMSDHI